MLLRFLAYLLVCLAFLGTCVAVSEARVVAYCEVGSDVVVAGYNAINGDDTCGAVVTGQTATSHDYDFQAAVVAHPSWVAWCRNNTWQNSLYNVLAGKTAAPSCPGGTTEVGFATFDTALTGDPLRWVSSSDPGITSQPPSSGGGAGGTDPLPDPTPGNCPDAPSAYSGSDDSAGQVNALRADLRAQCLVLKSLLLTMHVDVSSVHQDLGTLQGPSGQAHTDAAAIETAINSVGDVAHADDLADRAHYDSIEQLLGPLGDTLNVHSVDVADTTAATVNLSDADRASFRDDSSRTTGGIYLAAGLVAALFMARFLLPRMLP